MIDYETHIPVIIDNIAEVRRIGVFVDKLFEENKRNIKKKGSYEIIELKEDIRSFCLNSNSPKKIRNVIRKKIDSERFLRINTLDNSVLKITDDQKLYTSDGWITADKLKVGMKLVRLFSLKSLEFADVFDSIYMKIGYIYSNKTKNMCVDFSGIKNDRRKFKINKEKNIMFSPIINIREFKASSEYVYAFDVIGSRDTCTIGIPPMIIRCHK